MLLTMLVLSAAGCGQIPGDEHAGSSAAPAETGQTGEPAPATTLPPAETVPVAIALPKKGRTLGTGSKGKAVAALQRALAALGFDPGEPDGYFGEKTRKAVIAFQQQRGLGADGIVGAKTVQAINDALRELTQSSTG